MTRGAQPQDFYPGHLSGQLKYNLCIFLRPVAIGRRCERTARVTEPVWMQFRGAVTTEIDRRL